MTVHVCGGKQGLTLHKWRYKVEGVIAQDK